MAIRGRKARKEDNAAATVWFDSFPDLNPPGWDDKDGWCLRHWAPLAAIADPAARARAEQLASMDLMVTFAVTLRSRMPAATPVPARHLSALIRDLSPICCRLRDSDIRAIVTAALDTAA